MRTPSRHARRLLSMVLLAFLIANASAQQEGQQGGAEEKPPESVNLTHEGNRTAYRLSYFDFDNVRNLEQLLDQIPDLQLALDDSLRGSDYLVLINTHIVGKAPRDLRDIGRRFSLNDIKRIVIWRGPVALERAGVSGPAINIVLKPNADLSLGRWELNTPLVNTQYNAPNIKLSFSDRDRPGNWAYEVFADYLPNAEYKTRKRKETYLDADDLQPTQQRLTEYDDNNGYYGLGGSVNFRLSEKLDLRTNARVSESRKDRMQQRWIDDQENASLTALEDDRRMYELGLATVFKPNSSSVWDTHFNLIEEIRDRLVTSGQAGGSRLTAASATRHEDRRFSLISSFSSMTDSGSEASLAVYARRRQRDALSAISLDPLELASDAEIDETRTGLVGSYNWQSRKDFRLFTSLDIEHWHLKQQNGPFFRDDAEVFVKPAVNLRWKISGKSSIRVSARRDVRRLNFDQLVFNFDLDDEIIDTGNLSMVPEKNWISTAFVERRVLGNKGRVAAGAFYRLMQEHIDREPRMVGSGPGNIGDAYARGMQLTGRYEVFDNPGMLAVIKADLTFQESEVTDPFTGQDRRVKGVPDRVAKLELRQEFPSTSFDYVLDMVWMSERYYSDFNYFEVRSLSRPIANLKANYQASDNIQVWLEVRGLLDLDSSRDRTRYKGDAALGQVSRYEESEFFEDRQFAVGLQGYF